MKSNIQAIPSEKLSSIFGKYPTLKKPLPVGQLHIPEKERIRDSFEKIFFCLD